MSIFSYMLTIWGIMFWIFRAVITILFTSGVSFPIVPLNANIEIALIFASIPCIIFVLRRNIIGAACYMAIYVSYFGTALFNSANNIIDGNNLNVSNSIEFVLAIIGVVIPILTFIDILLNKNRKAIVGGKSETDWYYKNDKYDREFDERADRNQYKIR